MGLRRNAKLILPLIFVGLLTPLGCKSEAERERERQESDLALKSERARWMIEEVKKYDKRESIYFYSLRQLVEELDSYRKYDIPERGDIQALWLKYDAEWQKALRETQEWLAKKDKKRGKQGSSTETYSGPTFSDSPGAHRTPVGRIYYVTIDDSQNSTTYSYSGCISGSVITDKRGRILADTRKYD